MKDKNLSIETLRGFAILLVVIGHVIGSTPEGGMKIDFPSPFRYAYLYIDYIQMPLFTAIAGFVYAYRPVGYGMYKKFTQNKAIKLLLPMVVVGTLYFLLHSIIPGTNSRGDFAEIWKIYIYPYTVFWYLPSLFLIFALVGSLNCFGIVSNIKEWGIFLLVSIFGMYAEYLDYIPQTIPNILSFRGALTQLPFFVVGVILCKYNFDASAKRLMTIFCSVFTLLALCWINLKWYAPSLEIGVYKSVKATLVLFTLFLVLKIDWKNKFGIYIGKYSYSIYLFHIFFTGGVRILMVKMFNASDLLTFVVVLCFSVSVPIIMEKVIERSKILSLLLLGQKFSFEINKSPLFKIFR